MMSSATLTEPARREKRAADRESSQPAPAVPAPAPARAASSGLRPWHFFFVASALLALVTVVVMQGQPLERLLLAVATVGAAGYAGHSLFRMLTPLVSDDIGEDATMVAGRTRAALERDKMLSLRAIKELEFDRAMGKIAEGDFDIMRDRLRARALRLITQLDGAAVYREMIERDLAARVPSQPERPDIVMAPATTGGGPACTECGTTNDADARFCKGCGRPLQVTA
jgi:hypothetical protein